LYDLLRTVVTVETEGISSTLILEIGGETFDYEVGTSELHLEEKGGVLKIYVPRDEDRQEICFHSSLPRRLFSWLMTRSGAEQVETMDDEAAVNVMQSVLNCSSNSVVPHILTKEGVPEIDIEGIEETPPPSSTPEEEASPITPTRPNTTSPAIPRTNSTGRSANWTPRSQTAPSPGDHDSDYPTPLTNPDDFDFSDDEHSGIYTPVRPRPPITMMNSEARDAEYRRLLEKVIDCARRTWLLDVCRSNLQAALRRPSVPDADEEEVVVHYANDWERRMKTGAAGELFVSLNPAHLAMLCDSDLGMCEKQ